MLPMVTEVEALPTQVASLRSQKQLRDTITGLN